MYSLICRHAKVSLIPNNQPEDRELSNYKLDRPSSELKRAQAIKKKLENNKLVQYILFVVTITGTSMVIGDGVLTPCISGNWLASYLSLINLHTLYTKCVWTLEYNKLILIIFLVSKQFFQR